MFEYVILILLVYLCIELLWLNEKLFDKLCCMFVMFLKIVFVIFIKNDIGIFVFFIVVLIIFFSNVVFLFLN